MTTVHKFSHDKWIATNIEFIEKGHTFFHEGRLLEALDKACIVDGQMHLPAKPHKANDEHIVIAVGGEWDTRPNVVKAMEYTFSGCHDFGDGTAILGELTAGPGHIYSPRLPEDELEAWCSKHIETFHAHYEQNKAVLENGELVQAQPWW